MKITTKKLDTSRYAVLSNGRDIGLRISKGAPAGYREVQQWDVCHVVNDDYLFSAKGLHGCVSAIQAIVTAANARAAA